MQNEVDLTDLTDNYATILFQQCEGISEDLSAMDPKLLNLVAIQATYNVLRYHLAQLNDIEKQKEFYSLIQFDSQDLVFAKAPTTSAIGHA